MLKKFVFAAGLMAMSASAFAQAPADLKAGETKVVNGKTYKLSADGKTLVTIEGTTVTSVTTNTDGSVVTKTGTVSGDNVTFTKAVTTQDGVTTSTATINETAPGATPTVETVVTPPVVTTEAPPVVTTEAPPVVTVEAPPANDTTLPQDDEEGTVISGDQ